MLDPKYFRTHLDEAHQRLAIRGFDFNVDQVKELEAQRKTLQTKTQELQHHRNASSKEIGLKKAKGENVESLLSEMRELGDALAVNEKELSELQQALYTIQATIPNLPHSDVPEGLSEEDNLEIRKWGTPTEFDFSPKEHSDLGEQLGLVDFSTAGKITGSRFAILRGAVAKLHRALIQFMIDVHTNEHGYQEIYVPYLVNADSLFSTGQLPKFAEDLFQINGEQAYYLIPTAEVPVTNIARDVILNPEQLPTKYVCHTPCFRSEAGSYGKDTRGLIRQHQFEKVELVQFSKPESSYQAHEELTGHAEAILQKLKLPYRVVLLCGGDLGFSSAKTYDIEVWLPGQQKYREISSCSNFEDFQARRMQARWRDPETAKPELIHTLNGSGLPIGRTLVAIMENYQDKEGRIHIPEVLWDYMGGMKIIGA